MQQCWCQKKQCQQQQQPQDGSSIWQQCQRDRSVTPTPHRARLFELSSPSSDNKHAHFVNTHLIEDDYLNFPPIDRDPFAVLENIRQLAHRATHHLKRVGLCWIGHWFGGLVWCWMFCWINCGGGYVGEGVVDFFCFIYGESCETLHLERQMTHQVS